MQPAEPRILPSPEPSPPGTSSAQSRVVYSKEQLLNILAPDTDLPVDLPRGLRFA